MRGLLLAAFILVSPAAWAAEIEVEAPVAAATLYPQGASVERSASFQAEAGRHSVLIVGMPANYRRESLRIEGTGAFAILSIEERRAATRALEAQRRSPRRDIEEAIRLLQDRRIFATNAIQAAQRQLTYIDAMTKAQAQASATKDDPALVNASQWTGMWTSIGEGTKTALDTRQRAQIEIREIDEQMAELNAQLRDVGTERRFGPVLAVQIEAKGAVSGTLTARYQMDNANWAPVYDARLSLNRGESDDPSMVLVRRARVRQGTGEDWTGIALTLSTARPSGRAGAPDPRLLFARIQEKLEDGVRPSVGYMADQMVQKEARTMAMAPPPPPPAPPVMAAPAQQVMAVAQLQGETVEYVIPGTVDIDGSGEPKQVLIDERDGTVTLEVRATPSLDKTAYLYAEFENATEAPVLPGTASLYRDGVFVGTTMLARIAGGETTHLPFGSYDSIKITHTERERMEGEQGLIRARQTERRRYIMTAENLGDKPMPVAIRDSMPYAENEDVEITLRTKPAPDERDVDDRKGALLWQFTLEPGEKREIEHGYDVTYPTGVTLFLPR